MAVSAADRGGGSSKRCVMGIVFMYDKSVCHPCKKRGCKRVDGRRQVAGGGGKGVSTKGEKVVEACV